jgi:hypothetical protein
MKRNIGLGIFYFTYSIEYLVKELTTFGNEKEVCKTFATSFLVTLNLQTEHP